MTDVVTPDIQRVGRWYYEVRVHVQPADDSGHRWIGAETLEPALVLGKRWARWKARRMVAAELREQGRR